MHLRWLFKKNHFLDKFRYRFTLVYSRKCTRLTFKLNVWSLFLILCVSLTIAIAVAAAAMSTAAVCHAQEITELACIVSMSVAVGFLFVFMLLLRCPNRLPPFSRIIHNVFFFVEWYHLTFARGEQSTKKHTPTRQEGKKTSRECREDVKTRARQLQKTMNFALLNLMTF